MPHWIALLTIVVAVWLVLSVVGGCLIGRGLGIIERHSTRSTRPKIRSMPTDPVAQRDIDRLKSEIDRLRDVERHLRRERDRVRSEATSELERLQSALREAAAHAGAFDGELAQRDADATAREEAPLGA